MILAQNVSKVYHRYENTTDRLKFLADSGQTSPHDFWALRDITFQVERGEILGLIGPNGCGKSTLLQIVSGILQPTYGRVVAEGRIAALLELGAGFNAEFTGRENVLLNGEILGRSREQMTSALPAVERFADIGEFFDRPVKEYSSGMYVRLAFAAAIHVEPDILVVDEALAVGDAVFANRCVRKFEELRERQTTIVFVSHDLGLVKQLAHRSLLLSNGQVLAYGETNHVINRYIGLVLERQADFDVKQDLQTKHHASYRHGDRTSEVIDVQLRDDQNLPLSVVEADQPVAVHVKILFHRPCLEPKAGILIRTRIGTDVFGTNTKIEGVSFGQFEPSQTLHVQFHFQAAFTPQHYTITIATQNDDGTSHDWLDDVLSFEVVSKTVRAGVANIEPVITWTAEPANQPQRL